MFYFEEGLKMLGKKNTAVIASIGLVVLLVALQSTFAADKLFIVANQKSLDLAKDFLATLNNESIPLQIVLDQYDKVKKEKYVVVLGGAKGPGSVDGLIKQILTSEEQEIGNKPGGRIYVRENAFTKDQGQFFILFTGPDEAAAAEARKNSRKTWWTLFTKWFDLDTSAPMAY
jgi:hypothetical protein